MNGTNYIYDLRSSGPLWRGFEGQSTGWTGWWQLDSGVTSLSVHNVNGTETFQGTYDTRTNIYSISVTWKGLARQ